MNSTTKVIPTKIEDFKSLVESCIGKPINQLDKKQIAIVNTDELIELNQSSKNSNNNLNNNTNNNVNSNKIKF